MWIGNIKKYERWILWSITPECINTRKLVGMHGLVRTSTMWIGNIPEWSGLGFVETTIGRHGIGTTGSTSFHPVQHGMEPDG